MNNSTTLRCMKRIAMSVLAVWTVVTGAHAQCDITWPGNPNPVVLPTQVLDNVNGQAQLTYVLTNASGITSTLCGPVILHRQVRFYTDATKTTFYDPGPYSISPTGPALLVPSGSKVEFDCDDPNSSFGTGTHSLWVAINDGSAPFIPNGKASESQAVPVTITVLDLTLPEIKSPIFPATNVNETTSSVTPNNCLATLTTPIAVSFVTKTTHPMFGSLAAGRYTDNCSNGLTVTYDIDYPANNVSLTDIVGAVGNDAGVNSFPVGVSTVTYYVTDASGNVGSTSFTVTVTDDEDPQIICPQNITVNTSDDTDDNCTWVSAGIGLTQSPNYPLLAPPPYAVYSDNCEIDHYEFTSTGVLAYGPLNGDANGYAFYKGVNTITYEVEDEAGNTATCSFTVTVVDDEDPKFTFCPADVTVYALDDPYNAPCDFTVPNTAWDATANDNCDGSIIPTNNYNAASSLSGAVLPLGMTTVIWTATDAVSNSSTCDQVITVLDTISPSVTFASTMLASPYNADTLNCFKLVTFYRPHDVLNDASDCNGPVIWGQGVAVVNGIPDPNFLSGLPVYDPLNPLSFGAEPVTLSFPVGTTVIPYYWEDAAGNRKYRTIKVVVVDNILPTVQCKPGPIALTLDNNGVATVTPALIDNGSTDNCGPVTLSVSPTSYDCSDIPTPMPANITLTVTDAGGNNTATCSRSVTVTDNQAPQVICLPNITISANEAGCKGSSSALGLTNKGTGAITSPGDYRDNCSTSLAFTVSGVTTVGSTPGSVTSSTKFNLGTSLVTYTITDASGLTTTCTFNVTVTDNVGPNITPAQNVYAGNAPIPDGSTIMRPTVNNGCLAQVNWNPPTATDACGGMVNLTSTHAPNSFFVLGNTTVVYTATDASGNTSTYSFIIQVKDQQLPTAKCRPDTVLLNAMGVGQTNSDSIDNGSLDNCFFSLSLMGDSTYDCTNLGANIITLKVTDGAGNTRTCNATVTVLDKINPVANCIAAYTLNLPPDGDTVLIASSFNNGSTDNTNPSSPSCPLNYSINENLFDCSDIAENPNVVTLTVTDAAGNTNTCTVSVTVKDVTPPSYNVPADVTINCDQDPEDLGLTGDVTNVFDACDNNPTIEYFDSPIPGCAGVDDIDGYVRLWAVTDQYGNTAYDIQVITVQDITSPVFTLPTLVELETSDSTLCGEPWSVTITAAELSDVCDDFNQLSPYVGYSIDFQPVGVVNGYDIALTSGTTLNETFPIGTSEITFYAEDDCGNTTTHVITVTVDDTKGPVIFEPFGFFNPFFNTQLICDSAFVIPNSPGNCGQNFSWFRPSALSGDFGDCAPFTVKEDFSNLSVKQAVNVSFPFNYNSVANVKPTVFFPVGVTTVTYTATDNLGNSSVCSFTIEVEDTQAPVLTCPPNQILPATCSNVQIPNYKNLVQISDNCNNSVVLTQSPAAGDTLGAIFGPSPMAGDQFVVTMIGKELYNADTCTFTVTLQDGDNPIPAVDPLLPLIDSCGGFVVFAPFAFDPCNPTADTIYGTPSAPVGQFLNTDPPSYFLTPGNYVITWVYNDGFGNISTQPQNITVLNDVFPPVAICSTTPLTVNLLPSGTGQITQNQIDNVIDNGSFDPQDCGLVGLSLDKTLFTCDDLNLPSGENLVVLTATDHKGNTDTCHFTVIVKDITAPVLSPIPSNVTLAACAPIPAPATITAVDICDDDLTVNFVQDTTVFVNAYKYTLRRRWSVTDDAGNSSIGTQIINISDAQAPTFTGAPTLVTVFTDPDDLDCMDTVSLDITPFVQDCDSTTLTITNSRTGQGANYSEMLTTGAYPLTFTATDGNGNSATHSVILVVIDGTNPIAACINGISVALQTSGTVTVTAANINASSSDNCTPQNLLDLKIQRLDPTPGPIGNSITFDCDEADSETQRPVRLYVKDQAGNEATCQTYVIIQDNVVPTITFCPPNKTIACDANLSPDSLGFATAIDNCPNVEVDYTDTIVDGTGQICKALQRRWVAFDQADNEAVCIQVINLLDTVAPVFVGLPNDTITVDCGTTLPDTANVTATDNCNTVAIEFALDTINAGSGDCGNFNFTQRRTWTATDECGNESVFTQYIVVQDTTPPSFPGLPDTITVKSSDYPPNLTCTVPVTLDATQYLTDCQPDSLLVVTNNAPQGDTSLIISGNYEVGTYVVYFEAEDACGNVGVDSVIVNVIDNSVPTLVCNNDIIISLGTNGVGSIDADDVDLGSTDNCGIDTMFLSQSEFDCTDLGVKSVTLTAIDASGNSNTCTVDVTVTLGTNAAFTVTATGSPESFFGADNGSATATVSGGSGQFTYSWNTGNTTLNINGLSAGVYTITVKDSVSGCIQTDTAVVDAGVKIALSVGNADGCTGQTVSLPVTVDNFIDVTGFQFTLHPNDAAVGTILGVTAGSVNPAIQDEFDANLLAGNNLGIFWFDSSLTLPNGTILFSIDIQLGNAPAGSTTPVVITGTPVNLQFLQDSSGASVVTAMVDVADGEVEITCGTPDLEIGGDIQTWRVPTQPVPGVEVSLTGGVTANQTTGLPGTYLFGIPDNTNTTVSCEKETPGNDGLTGADVLLIKRHVLNIQQLASPYQFVAADVSGEGNLSLIDYARIQQVALGLLDHITGSPDWKFIPKSYVFPNPPLSVLPFPQSISHTPADMDFLDDDFVAVRMGDVNGSINPSFTGDDADDRGETFRFRLEERAFQAGEIIEVPFKAANFNDRSGWQMTVNFDPKVFALEGIVPGSLPEMNSANFGVVRADKGQLTTLWVTPEPMTVAEGQVLFTLKFKVLRNGGSIAEVLRPGSEITRAEAYDRDGNATKLDFEFVQPQTGAEAAAFALYQNQPNPFNGLTTIGFRLPEAGSATLRVFSASGQLVKMVVGDYDKGYNELSFRRDEFGAPGVYYYELETVNHSDRKKMILID